MSEEKRHSPGPWVVDKHAAFAVPTAGHMVYAEGGEGYNGHLVCQLHNVYSDNQKANAHLIAAAPDLYEALLQVAYLKPDYTNPEDYVRSVRKLATAAIEKAQKGTDQ